eukprot:gene2932-biopygen11754
MLGGSGGVGKLCGQSPTPPLPPSVSPPHLEWVLVPTTLTMYSYGHDIRDEETWVDFFRVTYTTLCRGVEEELDAVFESCEVYDSSDDGTGAVLGVCRDGPGLHSGP